MSNPNNFVNTLKKFDKDNIKEGTLKKLQKFINEPRFNPENLARFSAAAVSICKWIIAVNNYA